RIAETLPARAAAAAEYDAAERKARLEGRRPLVRLPRRLEVGWSNPPQFVQLEMTRGQVAAALPRGNSVVKHDGPDYVSVVVTGEAPKTIARSARQAIIRFGPDQRVAEIRVRYAAGPAAGNSLRWITELVAGLVRTVGAAVESPGTWSAVWSDQPAHKPAPVLARWQDDISLLTVQRDGATVEVSLRDCPLGQPAGVALPPLAYLPPGPESIFLGDTRTELFDRLKLDKPRTLDDGGLVIPPPRGSAYDALLVWFENERVVRIVGRNSPIAAPPGSRPTTSASDLITQTWARSFRSLGWPTRQDAASDGGLVALGWHDDQVRVRIFAQEGDDGQGRVFTEWKEIAEKKQK
ncbi:MAG TPA: hypothetical protein VKE94_16935, partial [Gemmataceae bacterium]|nr:hypothetical protein [Gemmataceae bacterium]